MDLGLKERRVIVTGASSGIGLATAEAFAREGARVALCSRDAAKLRAAEQRVADQGAEAVLTRVCDVSREAEVEALVAGVAELWGAVDVCVSNAGGPPAKGFMATTSEEWQRAVDLNLMSTVFLARAVIPHMQKRRWGRIVTLTSVSVRQPIADLVYSNAVRAGAMGLVKSLANEFGRDGITVNNVGPGYTATERLKELGAKSGKPTAVYLEELGKNTPVGRVGEPGEVADAIVFLASERAGFITGQTLLVDGGFYRGL